MLSKQDSLIAVVRVFNHFLDFPFFIKGAIPVSVDSQNKKGIHGKEKRKLIKQNFFFNFLSAVSSDQESLSLALTYSVFVFQP